MVRTMTSFQDMVIEINRLNALNKELKMEVEHLKNQLNLAEQLLREKDKNEAKYVGINDLRPS